MYIQRLTTADNLQSNSSIQVLEDETYFYVLFSGGFDVFLKSTNTRSAYVTRSNCTTLAQSPSTIYLGTSDNGVYFIDKINLSGNSTSSIVSLFTTTTTPALESNNIKCISSTLSADPYDPYGIEYLLIGTNTGINFFNGDIIIYSSTISGGVKDCTILGTKLYYVVSDGIYYRGTLPTGNSWSTVVEYTSPTYAINNTIHSMVIEEAASTAHSGSNRICIGTDNGVYFINTDESIAPENATIAHVTALAGGITTVTSVKLYGAYLYAKTDSTTVGYTKISLSDYSVVDKYVEKV